MKNKKYHTLGTIPKIKYHLTMCMVGRRFELVVYAVQIWIPLW